MSIAIDNRDPLATVHIENGTVFVARRVADAQQFKIAALIGAGALHDTIPGIAHFFEHLPFNATANFKDGEIFNFFLSRGGSVNAFTTYDSTIYHGEVQKENYKDGIMGIAELVCNPIFEDRRIADETQTILTEWAMRQGIQGFQRYALNRRASLGTDGSPEVIGTLDSIQSIKKSDLTTFYQQHYTGENLIVYMQGDLNPNQMIEEGIKQFNLPHGIRTQPLPVYKFQASTLPVTISDAVATHTTLLFPGLPLGATPSIFQAAQICGQMICSIEGGILKEARFSKRMIYGTNFVGDQTLSWGFNGIEFDAFPDKVTAVCEVIMRHLSLLASNPDQLLFESTRRNRMIGIGEFLRKTNETTPKNEVRAIWASGIIYPNDAHLNSLPNLRAEDIAAYARTHLATGPLSVVYEGKINPNFPSHEDIANMKQFSGPFRTDPVRRDAIREPEPK